MAETGVSGGRDERSPLEPASPLQREWDAEDYAAHSASQQQWARELIDKLRLRGDEALLDVGCGDGRTAALLAERLPLGSVLGIDQSESMVRLAERQFPASRYHSLSFQLMDATRIELPPRFDVALSTAALHWVEDHQAVLRGLRACLKPSGRIMLQMGGRGNAAEALAVAGEVIVRPRWRSRFAGFTPPYAFYGPEEYERWLPEAGFHLLRAELVPKEMRHKGEAQFMGWLRTTWFPYSDRLPEGERDAFFDDVLAAYTAVFPPDADGVIHVKMVRLEVEAAAV